MNLYLYIINPNEEGLLEQIEQAWLLVSVKSLKFHLPNPGDEPFLEVALSPEAKAMVTVNKRYFPKKEYEGTKVLSPAEFLEVLKEKI